MKYALLILIITLFSLGCAPKGKIVLFSQGERWTINAEIYHPDQDTVLVVTGPAGSNYYSYHVRQYTDSGLVLKNVLGLQPFASLISNEKDSVFRITFIDSENQVIRRTNPYIIVNDSIECSYDDYNLTFNFFYKLDSIYSMYLEFGEGFNFEVENLSIGKTVIKLHNYKESESRSYRTIRYHDDYFIKTDQKIDLADSSTWSSDLKLRSAYNTFTYRGTIELNKKQVKRQFNWNNVPLK